MKTLKMSVENMGFLLDRFAQDCGPLQYVRELTQNSIEAIRKAGRERGYILWGFDERIHQKSGIKKLSITDNGCGMSSDDMLRYLNNLSSSSSQQAANGNYGIGAKISAAAKNQAGIAYFSWRDGQGHMVYCWKDPATGEYGLKPFDFEEVEDHVLPLTDRAIDEYPIVAEARTGTHVVLYGMTDNEDTFSSNKEVPGRSAGQWVRRYLNTRYYRIPDNIEISCRTGGGGDEQHRYVTGQGAMLDAVCLEQGKVALSSATALWWIVPKFVKGKDLPKPIRLGSSPKMITKMDSLGTGYDITGHLAALYQNELHDTLRGNPARSMLQHFGITFGYDQVIIYIEPHGSNVIPNLARTALLIDSEPIKWAEWAEEFRARLPKQLRAFIDSLQPASFDSQAEDERIRAVMDLYRVPKFKPDPAGTRLVAELDSTGRPPSSSADRYPSNGSGSRPGRITQNAYGELISTDGVRASEVQATQEIPTVQLVSAQSREKLVECFGDAIAAQTQERPEDYYPNQAGWFVLPNSIQLNLDFGGVRSFIEMFAVEYGNTPAVRASVSAVVLSWWSQTLKEAIQGTRTLAHTGVWTKAQVMRAVEGDAGAAMLTAAVMPRYLVHQAINREIRGRLGSLTKTTAAPLKPMEVPT